MKTLFHFIAATLLLTVVSVSQDGATFKVPITVTSGSFTNTIHLGVNTGNTIGIDEEQALGEYVEEQLPPPPPPPFDFDIRFITIPFRPSNYPQGLGTGVAMDIRGYVSPSQVDTFRIQMSGSAIENGGATISRPSDLNNYAASWTIKGIAGTTLGETSMLSTTSVTVPSIFAALQVLIITDGIVVSNENPSATAYNFSLNQNYPNPFNPETVITYTIPVREQVTIDVFNIYGQKVHQLMNDVQQPGTHRVRFVGNDLPSGTYFYRLQVGSFFSTKKMLLLK